ncbi:MAG: hypothetical protein WC845_02560 [Candidatus Staskawiczbacteria bacterium]|jgi:hypothetical protein
MITLEQAIEKIKQANPFMEGLLDCDESLIDYCRTKLTTHKFNVVHLERQKPYVEAIKEKIDSLFKTEDVRINYDEGMLLDTTDHHNLLDYPTTLGAHLISRFDTILDRKNHGDYYVLDCGNIPFHDPLHKRGVTFAGKHLNLYPKSAKNKLVSRYPLYKFDLIDWLKKSGNTYTEEEVAFIQKLQGIIDNVDFSTCNRLSDQIVKINYYLWQEFFDPQIRDQIRRCITLEHDEILIKYLSQFLLDDKENIIWKLLFDKRFRDIVLKEFDGIYGAWNYLGPNTGTHFFWGFVEDEGKEFRMELRGEKLVNPDGKVRDINLTPEDVTAALRDGIIIPSIFTKFSFVAFYLGAKTMGGPGQTEYTGKLHDAWLRVLINEDPEEYELVKQASVLNFNCGDVAFTKDKEGNIKKEFGFDIAMSHRFSKEYLEKLGQVKFKYLLYPFTPISYYRLTPAAERQELEYSENDLYQGFNWVK